MIKRIFVEKKPGFRVEADCLRSELNENLGLSIRELRYLNVYDLSGFDSGLLDKCRYSVFGEIVTDTVSDDIDLSGKKYLAVEYIPGQFDQRASSAVDCVHLIDPRADVAIKSSRLYIFDDDMSDSALDAIRHYTVNAVESRIKDLTRLEMSDKAEVKPTGILNGFTAMQPAQYAEYCRQNGLAMNSDDLAEVVKYFQGEKRDPSETELRILDTYWSDHCRHTTFTTELTEITVDDSFIKSEIENELGQFHDIRHELGRDSKSLCLMELATIGARYLKSKGLLDDMEQSEENNACSIFINVDVDGRDEKWLLQFKNETHNHPTEIEPFGGAATCLGGAIRDPLSGRAYVYQAMRVTGAGDITKSVAETIAGKLPQRVISRKAAAGYSSYGNQIGLATTHVREIYHPGYTAKRLEVGAVVGAVRADSVRRESPAPGDVILLLGGRTGRDGIGGATGSSKEHTEASLETCGSEVQKGNAPEERKLQRLFRRPEVTRLIKKSNDFGAGGVSVAIGELAAGLDIYLDRVPVKYNGLNATELAISESQERMAVVVEAKDRQAMEEFCHSENVEVTYVADVTDRGRMRMFFHDSTVADLSREFIDSAGARHFAKAAISAVEPRNPFESKPEGATYQEKFRTVLSSPNVCSQKGLVEMFDSTIGRSTVLMPYGGTLQRSETQVSVQKLPTDGYTDTASAMAFGYNPELSSWSPYHGAAYAVVEACSKVVACGADWQGMRFSYQEYFERMTRDPHSWGKPLAALLGTLKMQTEFGLPSIGGKDSMSGTFEHISVPPTLIAFGITTVKASKVISPELKWPGNRLYLIKHTPLANGMPDVDALKANWNFVHQNINDGNIVSAWASGFGGVAEGLAKMSFGNCFGFNVKASDSDLFDTNYGSILVESETELDFPDAILLGTVEEDCCRVNGQKLDQDKLFAAWSSPYAAIYPQTSTPADSSLATPLKRLASLDPTTGFAGGPPSYGAEGGTVSEGFQLESASDCLAGDGQLRSGRLAALGSRGRGPADRLGGPGLEERTAREGNKKPIVFIPAFPGTNCDYDSAKAFRAAGADVKIGVFRNLTPDDVLSSIDEMAENISKCQIFMLCGGFSAGDEPDGSGKFIANVLNNSKIAEQINALIKRGGLILGICNGFQALVKSGLLPYGKPCCVTAESPTLFRNDISRHISQMVTTEVASTKSPWLAGMQLGDQHTIAVSHGEGKFVVSPEMARQLFENGQVAFRYIDPESEEPTMESPWNPNGSCCSIEGIISPDGQILGKMGHSERYEQNVFKNINEDMYQPLFENAVKYFTSK